MENIKINRDELVNVMYDGGVFAGKSKFMPVLDNVCITTKGSRQIVDMLVEKKIGRLIVGYNAGWKQKSDMGKRNNQKFVQMPFARLSSYLRYKCEMVGIDFVEHEESYTSKCDALALEQIGKHEQYLGRRTKRGLFCSSIGKLINADQNGALNIMRKVVGDSYVSRIVNSGHSLCPVRYSNPFFRIV